MESRKQIQVGKLIQQQLSEFLVKEGFNIYGRAFVTISGVQLTPDLQIARIHVSIMQQDQKESALIALKKNGTPIRRWLGNRLRHKLRNIPELNFFLEETLDDVYKMDKILKKLNPSDPSNSKKEEE